MSSFWSVSNNALTDLRLGGVLQMDFHYYEEDCRADLDNRFDISKARLFLSGRIFKMLRFRMEYEFQGTELQQLVDAYADALINSLFSIRFGQFKVPFSLEWQTPDAAFYFIERSIGNSFAPKRDVGVMLHGSFFQEEIVYSAGIFNGNGNDGSPRGKEREDMEYSARCVIAPFKRLWPAVQSLQFGGSATHSRIDRLDIALKIKSPGMAGIENRNIYVFEANRKFGVLYGFEERRRGGIEAAWSLGPMAIQGEYMDIRYTNLRSAGGEPLNADFSAWYASAILFFTGENLKFQNGVPKPIIPQHNLDLQSGTLGAIGLAFRFEQFKGDETWIVPSYFDSMDEAEAYCIALNWIMNPIFSLIFEFSHTKFSDPIRVRVNDDGSINYIEKENVFKVRSCIVF
ncbi:hypothetical protein JXL19_03855 [bacterium]|nr:hypothetical protein [bacterium]